MRKIINFFKIHFLLCDTLFVVSLYYLCFGVFKKFEYIFIDLLIYNNADRLYPVFFNSCITLLGFLLTGISITMIFLKDDKLEPLKEGGHFKSILDIYLNAIVFCSLLAVISFVGLVAEKTCFIAHVTALILCVFAARLARCIWVIEQISAIIYRRPE